MFLPWDNPVFVYEVQSMLLRPAGEVQFEYHCK
jgi:hypothetical protein